MNEDAKEFWEEFKNYDLGIDVHGGNPYSPVWICGMEFGGGETHIYRYRRKENCDLAGDTQLLDPSPNEYEYARLATALIGCLTDKNILMDFENSKEYIDYTNADENTEKEERRKYREFAKEKTYELCTKRKYFCASGHGFRMNAYPLSLPNNNDWDKTRVYYNEYLLPEKVSDFVKEFKEKDEKGNYIDIKGLDDYKKAARIAFKKHVKKRMEKYRPKLIICTGSSYKSTFKELFLDEEEYNHKIPVECSHKIELYTHYNNKNNFKTYILLCNFLHNGYKSCIHEEEIITLAKEIRKIKELKWLDKLKAPQEFNMDDKILQMIDYTFAKIPDKTKFFLKNKQLKKVLEGKKQHFYDMIKYIQPFNNNLLFKENNNPSTGAIFWSYLDSCLCTKNKDEIENLFKIICKEVNNQMYQKADEIMEHTNKMSSLLKI